MLEHDFNDENIETYYQKMLVFALLPIILAFAALIIWFFIGCIKNQIASITIQKTISTVVVLFFLVHPTITKIMFSAFSCFDVEDESRLVGQISSIMTLQ